MAEIQKFEDILKLHNMSPELAQEFTDAGYHIGYIKNKEGEIEYTIPLPHARSGKRDLTDWEAATPAKITPYRHTAPNRNHKKLLVFSDAQIDYRRLPDGSLEPLHDERAIHIAHQISRVLKPDEIINLGDTVDLAVLSRFDPDSDHFHRTLGPSFQRVHDMYAQFRADNPRAKITEVDSNHNTRLKKFIGKNAMALNGIKQPQSQDDYPVLSYPFLTNLRHVGVNWVSGYGGAEYRYGQEHDKPYIAFVHGRVSYAEGSTAARESRYNPEVHYVRGHSHRMEMHYRTNRSGQYLASVVVGALCRIDGIVPSYHSSVDDKGIPNEHYENWQNSAMVIEDYGGDYNFTHIPIINGKAFYNGREYGAYNDE